MTENVQKLSYQYLLDKLPYDCEALLKYSRPELGDLSLFITDNQIRFFSQQFLVRSMTEAFLYLQNLTQNVPSLREMDHYLRVSPKDASFETNEEITLFYGWLVRSFTSLQKRLQAKIDANAYYQGDIETKKVFLQEFLDKISLETDREIMAKLIDIEDDILIISLSSNEQHKEQKLDFLTQKIAQYLGQDWINIVPEY